MIGLPWAIMKPETISNTFWEKASDEHLMSQIDVAEIENLFGKDVVVKSPKETPKKEEKPIEISVIDPKKSNNLTIMLSKFKMPFSEIRKAILAADNRVLNLDRLLLLEPFLPSTEDINAINNFTGEPNTLAKADKFYKEIMDIPRLNARFQALIFKESFEEKFGPIQTSVANTLKACKTLKGSKNFSSMLELVLALGNYLNGGTCKKKSDFFFFF